MGKWVEIYEGPAPEADVLVSVLESENIEHEVVGSGIDGLAGAAGPVLIRVQEQDADVARGLAGPQWRQGDFGDAETVNLPDRILRKFREAYEGGGAQAQLEVAQHYLRRHERSPEALLAVAYAAWSLNEGDLVSDVVDRALALSPDDLRVLSLKTELLLLDNATDDAAEICERLIRDHPDSPQGWLGAARVAIRSDRLGDASDAALSAYRQLNPEQHDITAKNLANVLLWLGYMDEAKSLYAELASIRDQMSVLIANALLTSEDDPMHGEALLDEARDRWRVEYGEFDAAVGVWRERIDEGRLRRKA